MVTYITIVNYTEKVVEDIKESSHGLEATKNAFQGMVDRSVVGKEIMQYKKTKYLKAAILNLLLAIIIIFTLVFTGCAHKEHQEFHHVVTLKRVKVHIVSDRGLFDSEKARFNRRINGYARKNNEIWLLGYEDSTGIYLKSRTLGHELMHLLHWENDKCSHPHAY